MNDRAAAFENNLNLTAEDWDALRFSLQDSVIGTTNLCSLAKNLGLSWPIRGKEEVPDRYLKSALKELGEMPEFFGKGNRLSLLYAILLETKRLDDPFVDMIQQLESVPVDESQALTPLEQLEVPLEFPVALMPFSEKTRSLCKDGGHETLSQLIAFLQRSPSAAMINDEFKQFFNGLNYFDKTCMRKFLPIRQGSQGIYLAEAIGHIGRRMKNAHAATLIYAYSINNTKAEWREGAVLPKAQALSLIKEVKQSVEACFELMPDEAQHLRCAIESGINASVRFFVSLNDPDLEALAIAIAMAALDMKPRLKGFIGSLLT